MNEIRIKSLAQLEEQLFFNSWHEDQQRHRTRNLFRGLPDSSYRLVTSLQRLGGDYARIEKYMLRNFLKYAPREVAEKESVWHWLSIAQHHGLPTRLLDWTNSPLAALHFVTRDTDRFGADGVVWAVDFHEVRKLLPQRLQAILGTAKVFTVDDLRAFTVGKLDQLAEAGAALTPLEWLAPPDFMLFFEPPALDERITNQYAAFSVMSRATLTPEDWLVAHPMLCRKLIIPAELKSDIRDHLDMLNATERVFFPGLDGLCAWLKRYYGPTTRRPKEMQRVIFAGKHLHFCRAANGWEYVQRPHAGQGVTIVATTAENKLVLVEQHRTPLGRHTIELPAGLVEGSGTGEAEAIEAAVKRELQEETGYACARVRIVAAGSSTPGLTDELNALCLAEGLRRTNENIETVDCGDGVTKQARPRGVVEEGENITVYEVPVHSARAWLDRRSQEGVVVDLKVYAGLYFIVTGAGS
jgi:8-oxo-dGTP pyrophosphatase MutT (NUDIX family)